MSAIQTFYHDKIERATRIKPVCLHLCHVSQLIKSTSGDENYIDSYFKCNFLKHKIKKRQCTKCSFYKPLINKADDKKSF